MLTDPNIQPAAVREQFRASSNTDARAYAPARDLAYIGPTLVREALDYFSIERRPPPDSPYGLLLNSIPLNEQLNELGKVARVLKHCFIEASRPGIPDRMVNILAKAAEFKELNPYAVAAVLSRLGELTLGCAFQGILDVTPIDSEPPQMPTIHGMAAAAQKYPIKVDNAVQVP